MLASPIPSVKPEEAASSHPGGAIFFYKSWVPFSWRAEHLSLICLLSKICNLDGVALCIDQKSLSLDISIVPCARPRGGTSCPMIGKAPNVDGISTPTSGF